MLAIVQALKQTGHSAKDDNFQGGVRSGEKRLQILYFCCAS